MINPEELKRAYFKAGEDWFYDRYESAAINAHKWFKAFLLMGLIALASIVTLIILLPLKTIVPIAIHQNTTTGEVWVKKIEGKYTPENDAQVQSDIVRYLTAYLSYSPLDINQRFDLIKLMSATPVLKQYDEMESDSNPNSPVNLLGDTGSATIKVEDIVFIDKEGVRERRHYKFNPSHNLAKVDFSLTTTDKNGASTTSYFVATLSWEYRGTPQSQSDAWNNWNGFTVTMLRIDPRNVEPTK